MVMEKQWCWRTYLGPMSGRNPISTHDGDVYP